MITALNLFILRSIYLARQNTLGLASARFAYARRIGGARVNGGGC